MEPLLKCGDIKSHGQLLHLTHDMQLNLVVSIWDEKDGSDHSITIRVIDINSGNLVSQAALKNGGRKSVSCSYHPFLDKLVLTDGNALCVRRDTNGRFLLASVFTCPVPAASDEIALELLLPHAIQLKDVIDFASTCSTSGAPSINEPGFSSRKLNFSLIGSQLQEALSQITPETNSVVLKLRQSTFCSLLYWLMNILGDTMHCGSHLRNRVLSNAPTPPLHTSSGPADGVASNLSQTLKSAKSTCMQQPHSLLPVVSSLYLQAIMSLSDPYNEIPKEHMFAEVFRYETFLEWPHIDYEWAGPSSMALAGFYYQPACRAEDRAVCFQCGVSLVSWEPTDEPWSEHERHAPACPMVTGDVTANVPLSESESFEPAQPMFSSSRFSPTDNSSSTSPALTEDSKVHLLVSNTDGIVITASPNGNVVLWDATRRLRRCGCFYLISDIRGNQVMPSYKEKALFSCYCLPDVSHLAISSCIDTDIDGEARTHRKSSLGKHRNGQTTSDEDYVRLVAGGAFGEQNELFVLEYILEPPLWDSRCQTEGARSGAQPPFTSSSSAPITDQYNLLQYDMWDDDSPPSPPYEENSDNDDGDGVEDEGATGTKSEDGAVPSQDEEDMQEKLEQQVSSAAVAAIAEQDETPQYWAQDAKQPGAANGTVQQTEESQLQESEPMKDDGDKKQADMELSEIDVPPPDSNSVTVFNTADQDMDVAIPEPVISGLGGPVRQVFITKQQPSSGTEPVFAKRALKLPDIFQEGGFCVSAVHHIVMSTTSADATSKQQRLIVVVNDSRLVDSNTGEASCWSCKRENGESVVEPKIGGIVVYKFRPTLRRGGAQSSATTAEQHFDQPTAVYTIPAFLASQVVYRMPSFICTPSPDVESKSLLSSACCYMLNLLPGSNAIAVYAIMPSLSAESLVTSLNPITTLSLASADVDNRIGGEHITHFVYCADIDTVTAGSCQGRLSFWKKVGVTSNLGDLKLARSAKQPASECAASPIGIPADAVMNVDTLEVSGRPVYSVDISSVRQLLKVTNAVRLDQRYNISCPNGWSEMASDQASRMHPGGPGTDLSPTRAGCGPNPPTRSFVRHGSCLRDTYDVSVGQSSVIGEGAYYSSFDITFTHALHISHIVVSFGFDPSDCSLDDCKIYLLRQKDAWGAVKFGNLRPALQSSRPGLHALQTNFDMNSFEVLCGPVEVSHYVLRNEQPGPGSPSSAVKAVVMLSSPELMTNSTRSMTLLIEYSAGSVALAAAYTQQQHILAEGTVMGTTTPPPPSVGPPVLSATLSITPMYLPKYKQLPAALGKRQIAPGVDLLDFLFVEECQNSLFALCLSFATPSTSTANVETQAGALDAFSLLSWLLSVTQYQSSSEINTFCRISNKVVEHFDVLAQIAFILPATASREAASVLSEIVLLIAERCARRFTCGSVAPLIEKFLDGIFMDSVTSAISSPTILHLFLKLACRLAELHLVGLSSALPSNGFSKLASLGEVLSVQTHVERVPMVSGDALTASSRIFDLPVPSHLLDTFVRPSYAAVVAGLFGTNASSGFNIGTSGPGGQSSDPSKSISESGPWSNIMPTQLNHSLLPAHFHKSQPSQPSQEISQGDLTYATGPRHIFGLIEYECLHFRYHKFCQGARAGSPRSAFKVGPPPSIKLPVNSSASSTQMTGLDTNWQLPPVQNVSQPFLPLVHSYFPSLSEANANNPFGPPDGKKGLPSSSLMFTVDEVPAAEEVPVASNVPMSVIYVANPSSVPPTPKPTPYITPSVTPPNELSSAAAAAAAAFIPSILPNQVSVPSQLQSGSSPVVPQTADAISLGHNFDYLTNNLVLDYCNNWVAFDRSSASSRRFVDLDFGRPVVLTGFIIPVNADVLSVAVDVWLKPDDDKHHRAKRICSHMRLRQEPLIMLNLQPAPVCRFVRLWTFFTVGATQGRLSMCVGQYYGYSLLSACRLSSLSTVANLVGPSLPSPPTLGVALQPLVSLHSSVLQTCIEDQLYRFHEAMADMNAVSQVYASPSHMATLWTSGQRAIETRLRMCVGGAFVWRCQLNHCQSLATEIRALVSSSQNPDQTAFLIDGKEPLDKLQMIFYYLLRMFYAQARLGLHINVTVTDASRLFQAVCLFASEELRSGVGSLIVHFAADVDWWPEFFAMGLQKLFSSHLFFPDITSLSSSANSISLGDYCNLFILLIESNPDQATNVVVSLLETLRSSLSSSSSLFDARNIGLVLFLSICLDALLSQNHWMADMWSFAPGSLSSVKTQWNPSSSASAANGGSSSGASANPNQLPRLGGGPITRRGAVYKKKITKLSKLFVLSSLAKSPGQQDHVRFNVAGDDRSWPLGLSDENMSSFTAGDSQSPPSILSRLPVELCKTVTESLLLFVLESHRKVSSNSGPVTMVFADVHALKLAAYLSCFALPELTLSSIFLARPDSLADLLDLIISLKDMAVSGESSVEATRSAIRSHAAECFLKTVLLAEKISRKASGTAACGKETAEEPQGPFAGLFAAIKEQEDAPRSGSEDLFNRFFALLHATRCHQIKEKSVQLGKAHKCKAAECQPAKKLLEHWRQCNDASNCSYKHCVPLRLLVNHWRTCKRFDACVTCKELAKFPLVFEPTVMNSIESVAECSSLPDDGNGIVPPPEIDPTVISSNLTDLLFSEDADISGPLDVCFVDDYFDDIAQPPSGFSNAATSIASSPPLPPFAADCRYDFSMVHHAKYLLGCLQARNYADISTLPLLKGPSKRSQGPREEKRDSEETHVTNSNSADETSALIFQSLTRCLTASASRSLSSLARCCEIIDDLLPYTKVAKLSDNRQETILVSWYKSIMAAVLRAPIAIKRLQHTFDEMITLNTIFLETCNALMAKSNGSLLTNSVLEIFGDTDKFSTWISAALLIQDSNAVVGLCEEYGPTFCQTFVSFLRGVLEISIEHVQTVSVTVANCLCYVISHFIDAQLLSGSSAWMPIDIVGSILPFLVQLCKSVNVFSAERERSEWVRLGSNLIKVIALTCGMLPRTESSLRGRLAQGPSTNMSQNSNSMTRGRGRGRGLYAHRWDECSRGAPTTNDVVVMRVPPTNSELVKCAYPETATAFGSLLAEELALLEQILCNETLFQEILNSGATFSSLLSILYWNGICCQSASNIAASDPTSSVCALDSQQAVSAFGSSAYKTCQNIFNLLVDNFAQRVGPLLLASVCPSSSSSIQTSTGWDTRSAALVIVQAVLDRTPDTASAQRDVVCEILFACFEEIITSDKLAQRSRSSSSSNKLFDLSPLARVIPGSVNLPLANLISQQSHSSTSSSAFTSSRSQRLLYELASTGKVKNAAACPGFEGPSSAIGGDPRPVPIPTAQRGGGGRSPAVCGYTFAPGEDHFSFVVHFTVPVVLAEVVVGCDLSHSRGHIPQAIEIEVKSDKQSTSGSALPLRFATVSSTISRGQMPRDCIAISVSPPRVASSLLMSVYRPKSANVVYLNMISIRGFPLTSSGTTVAPQMLAEVDRVSSLNSSCSLSSAFGLPLSSTEVTFLSLLHSVTTLGKLRLLCSNADRNVTGLLRLASCSALALLAPSNVITPTILQNLLEMINICVDSLHNEPLAAQFVGSLVDVYIQSIVEHAKLYDSAAFGAYCSSSFASSIDVTAFCLFIYSLAHWRTSYIVRALTDKIVSHVLSVIQRASSWHCFDPGLLPIIQCLAYLLWRFEKAADFGTESLLQLFNQSVQLATATNGPPYWPAPVQALICAIFNHRSVQFEDLANSFVKLFASFVENIEVEIQRYDMSKAAILMQPLANIFMSPRCMPWFLKSPIVKELIQHIGTPVVGPLSACALGFATALCRSLAGCNFIAEHLSDSDWQQLLQNAVAATCDFRYQDLVLTFFISSTLTNQQNQMRLGAAFASLLRSTASQSNSANNIGPLTGSMPCFMRAFCNRLLLADSDIQFYCTPDFDDPSTVIYDTDIVPFAGFPLHCVYEFVPPAYSSSVRLSGPGRCIMLDLMTRSKRHHQLAATNLDVSNEDTVATKAAKMLKIASIAKRRTSKDLSDGDQAEELKVMSSLRDLCTKFAQEGGLERDAVSASMAWRPPARWLIKKCFFAPRRQGDQTISPNRSVRSLLNGFHEESLSSFYSTPLLELSGFAALPTPPSADQQLAASSNGDLSLPTVPHILSAFAQVGGLDALALFFSIPSANAGSAQSSATSAIAALQPFEQLPSAVSSVMAALMDPGSSDLPDDWVDIQDVDSDSTIEFASPKNVIVVGGAGATFNPTSLLASTASTLGLNSAGNLVLAQQFFLPISALALRVFSRLPELANLMTSVTCLPLTQAALRLALGLGLDMVQFQQAQASSLSSSSSSSVPGGVIKAMGLLPTLPFLALDEFVRSSSNSLLSCLDAGCVDLLLAAVHVLSRQPDTSCSQTNPFVGLLLVAGGVASPSNVSARLRLGDRGDWDENVPTSNGVTGQHWAKGTGFGSGPTSVNQSMDTRFSLARQRQEEQLLTLCFRLISRFAASSTQSSELPAVERMFSLISHSCFVKVLSTYLQNDSIMDVSRHLLLYESALNLWSVLAEEEQSHGREIGLYDSCSQMTTLLAGFDERLSAYIGTLRVITSSSAGPDSTGASSSNGDSSPESDLDPLLTAVRRAAKCTEKLVTSARSSANKIEADLSGEHGGRTSNTSNEETLQSLESKYSASLKSQQFRSWQVVASSGGTSSTFIAKVPYHFIGNMSSTGFSSSASRARRIAQETVSLRSSLPLSLSSSVFVVVDEARLDVMKVLITGPSDTPYANGCFEFDISLPADYPASPPLVHLCTTGNGQVRFNPNLYNDGKVCLSVLNTWHGRPEEKWNPQTSSLLQVLVSIQSLILVSEPYFNEPGYERSRGSAAARIASAEYSAEIMAQTLKWAVVEQLRRASPCFVDVIRRHFALKKNEVIAQCDSWVELVKSMGTDTTSSSTGGTTTTTATSGGGSSEGLFAGGATSDVVLIGSSGRRFQQMLVALRRSVDQVREELKNLDSLVRSGDVFGNTGNINNASPSEN